MKYPAFAFTLFRYRYLFQRYVLQCAMDSHCELFLDCYRINLFLLFSMSYTLLVAFPHQRTDSLEGSLRRLNLCSAAGETVICRMVVNMTSKYRISLDLAFLLHLLPLPFLPFCFLSVPFNMYVLPFPQFTQHCCGSHMIEIGSTELEILIFMNKCQCKLDTSLEYTSKNSAANYE